MIISLPERKRYLTFKIWMKYLCVLIFRFHLNLTFKTRVMLAFIFYSQNFHDNSKEWTNGWMSEAISDEKFWQLFLRFETEENTKQISSFYKAYYSGDDLILLIMCKHNKLMDGVRDRWLSSYKHWLPFQETLIQFPETTWQLLTICNVSLVPTFFRPPRAPWRTDMHADKNPINTK